MHEKPNDKCAKMCRRYVGSAIRGRLVEKFRKTHRGKTTGRRALQQPPTLGRMRVNKFRNNSRQLISDERKGGPTDGFTDGRANGRTDGRMDGRKDGWTDGRTDGQTNKQTDGRMDGWEDGRTDIRTYGRTDG